MLLCTAVKIKDVSQVQIYWKDKFTDLICRTYCQVTLQNKRFSEVDNYSNKMVGTAID